MTLVPMRLITLPISHYCEKVRWALDRQGLPYREEGHAPLVHLVATLSATGLRSRTVPILIDDNPGERQVVADSTAILRYLARRYEASWLFAAAEAAALEEQFDAELGPHTRRVAYYHLLPETALMRQRLTLLVPRAEAAIASALFPVVRVAMRKRMNIDAASMQRSLARVEAVLGQLGDRLRDGRRYLCGETLGAADITFAALAAPLLMPPGYGTAPLPELSALPPALAELVGRLRKTAAGQYALRLYAEERRR